MFVVCFLSRVRAPYSSSDNHFESLEDSLVGCTLLRHIFLREQPIIEKQASKLELPRTPRKIRNWPRKSFPERGAKTAAKERPTELVSKLKNMPSVDGSRARQWPRAVLSKSCFQNLGCETFLVRQRRIRALAKNRARLRRFLASFPHPNNLFRQGRYRTLQRRIFNLWSPTPKQVNMRKADGTFDKVRMLIQGFASLDRKVHSGFRRKTHTVQIFHDPQCEIWVCQLLESADKLHGEDVDPDKRWMRSWVGFPEDVRESSWGLILLYLLDHQPNHALQFLRVLGRQPPLNAQFFPEIITDSLEYLARIYLREAECGAPLPDMSQFVPTFYHLHNQHLWRFPAICSQDLLLNIARLASLEDLKKIYDHIGTRNTSFGHITLLHWAKTFAEKGDSEYALLCLKRIALWSRNAQGIVATDVFRWTCAVVLRKSMSNPSKFHKTSEIVAQFVAMGLNMDILLYNVIIANAMEAGDYSTAFRVYNLLESLGLQPDKFTYSTLLYGCTKTEDPAKFHEFAEYCANKAKEIKDPWLATDYLYYLYTRHNKERMDPQQLSSILLHTYSQFFSIRPLSPFRISHSPGTPHFLPGVSMDPPPVAIFVMLQMEIQNAVKVSNTAVWKLYLHFVEILTRRHHPVLNELAKTTHIWNAFLLAFCSKNQFANASTLIKNLTDGVPGGAPKPDVIGWTIFMHAFFKEGQVQAAERVFEIMKSRGVEPDTIAYQTLIAGYAVAQRIEKLGDVVEETDEQAQIHPKVLDALNRVHDRKRLMVELEKRRVAKEQRERKKKEAEKVENDRVWREVPGVKPLMVPGGIRRIAPSGMRGLGPRVRLRPV
ncbi:uncharacterized protein BDR25DRAFT_342277 [Lindgomyces ingoldianus]|uniref:Uncharacterized protein n=1 Tax=Lindgomyces ingoldianus TaxID=673940 RepID=A0ACB6QY91_9PLEO|nr:uncharacterized protein BDR25DRAFT_342277 [Lindgomyces ingoldianus]KAF2471533.1 hypothetical protein BDR25DRAFT_342277 [Lindgomyces ingoldianus]